MKILALETTGKYGSAAVIDDEGRVFSAASEGEMNHLKDVIIMSESALESAGVDKKELTHVAASVGPGSFTGIRIGVTTARTIAQMLDIPCVAVSSLEAMACNAAGAAAEKDCDVIAAVINARRHQTYAGVWKSVNGELELLLEERQYMIEELLEKLDGKKVFFVGDGTDAYGELIRNAEGLARCEFADEDIRYQSAGPVAELARKAVLNGEELEYEKLLPDYMRLSEAEQRLKEGTLSDKIKQLRSAKN